jgi:hypothetical protein
MEKLETALRSGSTDWGQAFWQPKFLEHIQAAPPEQIREFVEYARSGQAQRQPRFEGAFSEAEIPLASQDVDVAQGLAGDARKLVRYLAEGEMPVLLKTFLVSLIDQAQIERTADLMSWQASSTTLAQARQAITAD